MEDYQINIGDVLYLRCGHCNPPKNKFFIIASLEPEPILLFINSRLNDFVNNNPNLKPCHVLIEQSEHTFLQYDSWVNCCAPCFEFSLENIEQDMQYGGKHCGMLSNLAIDNILIGIKNSPTLEQKNKNRILASLTSISLPQAG